VDVIPDVGLGVVDDVVGVLAQSVVRLERIGINPRGRRDRA
jgi:hypothetical protein